MPVNHPETEQVCLLVQVAAGSPMELATGQEDNAPHWSTLVLAEATDTRCPRCEGKGKVRNQHGHFRPCPTCRGTGEVANGR